MLDAKIPIGGFGDFNGDGLLDLQKPGGHGEPHDGGQSYDPYLVFVQKKVNGKTEFILDEPLSKKWSLENKFYWHGPTYNEKLVIDKNGEPVENLKNQN